MNKKYFLICISIVGTSGLYAIPHTNLFNPYDILLNPPSRPNTSWQFDFAYERSVRSHSYQAAEDALGNSNCFRKKSDCVLRLYQDEQDFLAALKGGPINTSLSQLGQQFNLDDDNGTTGLFIPCGHLDINNIMLSARRYLKHGFYVSFYLPIIQAQLRDVCWQPAPTTTITTFDNQLGLTVVDQAAQATGVNLSGWKRTGIGDFAAIVWWQRAFAQGRPVLRSVSIGLRSGGVFPTAKKENFNELFAFPFGYDAGFGFLMGGTLGLNFWQHLFFGIDIELLYLFGNDRQRLIKTNFAQTDLLLFNKACTYAEPGFVQHFTLFGRANNIKGGLSGMVAYQYTKQQETRYIMSTINTPPAVVNNAESLQSWTVHNIIVGLEYDFYDPTSCPEWRPYLTFMYKHGFNGSRTMAFDTITAQIAVDF